MNIEKITDNSWRIPRHGKMRVDGVVYASHKLIEAIRSDECFAQVANVACLPGIVGASLATVAEEAPLAYKDVADVVSCVEGAGLARKIARLQP